MKCPYCGFEVSNVLESRGTSEENCIRRRRECEGCHKRFTTYERVSVALRVIKRNGQWEEFNRGKLEKGIIKACWKREVGAQQIDNLIDEIEMKLLNRHDPEIKSSSIGKMVLTRLKKIDTIAYLRFASVYLELNSVVDFRHLLDGLNPATR